MRVLESMVSSMRATGLYALDGTTQVDYELQAYAAGLDMVFEALTELQRESYIATASGYGLLNWESLLRIQPAGSTQERRGRILKRSAVTPNSFTRKDMEYALSAPGIDVEVCEYIPEKKIYVNCKDAGAKSEQGLSIQQAAKLFLPAHLDAELDFRSISWNNIDGENQMFDALEEMGLTWDAVDNYGGGRMQL
ncbi:DUF2313 domain-containing protein [Caproiciproducens galactitolivorans]|uniref:DUF2313 domain-containing protein n=1 Tax=Caproiciproducens galactitolivorans TaxID=642589 RepID=A0A4Z0Y2U4_9FIRM|nr:DUF2313 domain-containing protein [Caproiciproducens galactitolivorans]QEY35483.1 DUF2313 domain-containing protein [Caproiciproducens galactitolivorans]TGJ77197.1 hypothetical protein CAGA_05650 [Caproiciproducens galactitolivorans]